MRRHKRKQPISEINVVPYIDVMLVLLIIFMVTAPLLQQGVEVDLPPAKANPVGGDVGSSDSLIVSVDADGNYYLNAGEDVSEPKSANEIENRVRAVLNRKPETRVYLEGDTAANYGAVVGAMVLLQQAGVLSVGFLTDPPELQDQ